MNTRNVGDSRERIGEPLRNIRKKVGQPARANYFEPKPTRTEISVLQF